MTTDQRLIEIEIKVTRQEDLTQELSRQIYQQQKKIDELQRLCARLLRRFDEAAGAGDPFTPEKPPHY